MKKILIKVSYMGLFCLLSMGILKSCTQTPEQIVEKALHSSTVRLAMKDADGEGFGWGCGFFIDRDEIVTHIDVVAGATSIEAQLVEKKRNILLMELPRLT